jgi:putative alpha-1,2-mannosidase
MGFYSVDPVSGVYVLGSPLFDHVAVQLGNGRTLEVEVRRKNPSDVYIQAFSLNGKPQQRLWFRHADVASGGKLALVMGETPHPTLGVAPEVAPPSLSLT